MAGHFGFGCQGEQEITSQQQHPDAFLAANPRSLKASSPSHNERLNPHSDTNSSPLKMKEVCTHIYVHTNVTEGKSLFFSGHSHLQKALLMVFSSDTNSNTNYSVLPFYLSFTVLFSLCFTLPLQPGGSLQYLNGIG